MARAPGTASFSGGTLTVQWAGLTQVQAIRWVTGYLGSHGIDPTTLTNAQKIAQFPALLGRDIKQRARSYELRKAATDAEAAAATSVDTDIDLG